MSAIYHPARCTGEELVRFHGRLGDTLERCLGCGHYRVLASLPEPARPEHPVRRAGITKWRCAEHLDQQVDWRGRGCRKCRAENSRGVPRSTTQPEGTHR